MAWCNGPAVFIGLGSRVLPTAGLRRAYHRIKKHWPPVAEVQRCGSILLVITIYCTYYHCKLLSIKISFCLSLSICARQAWKHLAWRQLQGEPPSRPNQLEKQQQQQQSGEHKWSAVAPEERDRTKKTTHVSQHSIINTKMQPMRPCLPLSHRSVQS